MSMHIQTVGTVLLSASPARDAAFYVRHLGFTAQVELEWYVSLAHAGLPGFALDVMSADHAAVPTALRGQRTAGLFLAFIVADAHAEAARLAAEGVPALAPVTDEPWGQRRFQVQAPGSVLVELVQRIPPDAAWLRANMG